MSPPLLETLATDGIARVRPERSVDVTADPHGFAVALLGVRPLACERQPIRPLPDGRTIATGRGFAPFHTDSQLHLGVPPHLQVMVCVRPATDGGTMRFADGWALLDRLAAEDPALYERLLREPRRMPFVFGDYLGPTVSLRGGSLVFAHPVQERPSDPLAPLVRRALERAPVIRVSPATGEVVVIHNHRFVHGRESFEDGRREFQRLLVWLEEPLPPPAHHARRAAEVMRELDAALAGEPPEVRRRFGLVDAPLRERAAVERLALVLEMLRGAPPGALARGAGVPEGELYRWRDAALAAALAALSDGTLPTASAHDAAVEAALARARDALLHPPL